MDLLENPELIPNEVQAIIDTFDCDADSYKECSRICAELKLIGYTADYGLGGELTSIIKD